MTLPDAEVLLSRLVAAMREAVGPAPALVGIFTGGVWVAERLATELGLEAPGVLDVSFYRDDYQQRGLHRESRRSQLPFDVAGRHIILVDDVLYTGRTIRAAMNELFDYGRPASIRLATLVDRGGRELPIQPDFTGGRLELPASESLVLSRAQDGTLSLAVEPRQA